jgi:hypothetical protein
LNAENEHDDDDKYKDNKEDENEDYDQQNDDKTRSQID